VPTVSSAISAARLLAPILGKMLQNADVGSQVNQWLFGTVFLFLILLQFQTLPSLGQLVRDAGAYLADGFGSRLVNITPVPASQMQPTLLTPGPGFFGHGTYFAPAWFLAAGLIWFMFSALRHVARLLDGRAAWASAGGVPWPLAMLMNLAAFVGAPYLLWAVQYLWDVITADVVEIVSRAVHVAPAWLMNPFWTLGAAFGVSGPNGWDPAKAGSLALTLSVTSALHQVFTGALALTQGSLTTLASVFYHALALTIVQALVVLVPMCILFFEATLAHFFVLLIPLTASVAVVDPTSPMGLARLLGLAARAVATVALLWVFVMFVALIGGSTGIGGIAIVTPLAWLFSAALAIALSVVAWALFFRPRGELVVGGAVPWVRRVRADWAAGHEADAQRLGRISTALSTLGYTDAAAALRARSLAAHEAALTWGGRAERVGAIEGLASPPPAVTGTPAEALLSPSAGFAPPEATLRPVLARQTTPEAMLLRLPDAAHAEAAAAYLTSAGFENVTVDGRGWLSVPRHALTPQRQAVLQQIERPDNWAYDVGGVPWTIRNGVYVMADPYAVPPIVVRRTPPTSPTDGGD
jgi:hypothetical protein